MNLSEGRGASTSGGTWKSGGGGGGDVVVDQFPAGLRVLVVDDDPICLMILEKMLLTCLYKVTKCNRAEIALSLLRRDRNGFDIVISDVHMPDMDGFKLLEHIGLEMDLPVIMMSVDDGKNVVMKGVTHGACDYLIKPVRIEALKTIWQHVIRKKKNERREVEQSGSVEDVDRQPKLSDDLDYASSANEESWKNFKKRKDEDEETDDREDSSSLKKPRVVWSVELHQQFVAAVNQLGIDKAVPKKILELMNVQGLTRENVASHLQKFRLYLRRVSGQQQNGLNSSFMGSQETSFGSMSSLYEVDFQTLADAASALPTQSLATLQAASLGRSSTPLVDQRNILSFENPKPRFREVQTTQQQQQYTNTNSSKQVNLLHGIPTTLEAKQLAANYHPSMQSFQNVNMQVNAHQRQNTHLAMQMAQQQSRPSVSNDQFSRLQSSVPQPILSNGIVENGRVRLNTLPQASPIVSFPMTQTTELAGNTFPKSVFQQDGNSEMKRPVGFVPSYGIFNEMNHKRNNSWDSPNAGLTFNASKQTNTGFWGDHGQNRNVAPVGKTMFLPGERSEHRNVQNIGELMDPHFIQNSMKIKTERHSNSNYNTPFFEEHFGQEDLMSALLKQQEGMGPIEPEFDIDGYSIDNIPV